MRVLQISNYFFPHIGGIEQVAKDVTKALEGKCEQKVFCFNHERPDSIEVYEGISVVRAGSFAKVSSQSLSFSYGKLLKKTVKTFNPHVIIFHFPNPFGAHYLLKILKKRPDIKLVLYWHLDIFKQKLLKKLFKGQTKRLILRAEKIVATSPNYIEGSEWLKNYKEKCVVIPNSVDEKNLALTEQEIKKAEVIRLENAGKTILFAMGRHVPYKGIEYLVRASKYLDDSFKVYIGGEGELTESLKEIAKDDKKVVFLGRISDTYKKAFYSACDIFCFPSITKNEAFGIALAEAMYYGKPAVTFTIAGSGVNYVSLNNVTGLEVENSNPQAFADAIKKLAEDKELSKKYGEAASKRVKENFLFSNFAQNIDNLVKDVTVK